MKKTIINILVEKKEDSSAGVRAAPLWLEWYYYRCLQPTPDSERGRHARKKKNTKSGFSILG